VWTAPFVEFLTVCGQALYQLNLMDRLCES